MAALLARREHADDRSPLSEHKAIRLFDGSAVELVAHTAAGVAGYAHVAHHPAAPPASGHWSVELVVDPEAPDEKAIATELLDAAAASVDRIDEFTLWAWRRPDVAAARERRMHEIRALHEMRRDLPIAEREPLPAGIEVRPFRVGRDERAWLAANNAAFAKHRENGALDMDNIATRMRQPWFDPEGFLLAWRGHELVGSCWTKLHAGRIGEIYIIGVVPDEQGHGLGTSLVEAGLHDLADRQGARAAILYVDASDVRAVDFYRDLGFAVAFTTREFAER